MPLTFARAIVRYRLRDVEVIIKRGAGLHGVPVGQRGAVFRDADGSTGYLFANDADAAQLDRRAAGDVRRRACGAAGEAVGAATRSIACSIAIATTTGARCSASRAI